MNIRNRSTLLILIDPFRDQRREDKEPNNKYALRTLEYIKEPSNYINYFFVSVYDCLPFLKNEKWCGKTSKRMTLQNRVFTKKISDYRPASEANHLYCESLDSNFDEFNYKNILTTSAFFTQDLKDFLDTFPTIKNVMIAGEAWEQCIRFRPLGIYNVVKLLKDYPKVNLLVDATLIGGFGNGRFGKGVGIAFTEDGNQIIGEPSWEKIEDSLFYLPKNKYDTYLQKDVHFYEEGLRLDIESDLFHPEPGVKHFKLNLKDSISAKHLTLDLFDKVSNSDF